MEVLILVGIYVIDLDYVWKCLKFRVCKLLELVVMMFVVVWCE